MFKGIYSIIQLYVSVLLAGKKILNVYSTVLLCYIFCSFSAHFWAAQELILTWGSLHSPASPAATVTVHCGVTNLQTGWYTKDMKYIIWIYWNDKSNRCIYRHLCVSYVMLYYVMWSYVVIWYVTLRYLMCACMSRINSCQFPGILERLKPGTRPWTNSCRRVIKPLKRPWLVLPVIRTLEHYASSGVRWECQKI